jgi:hypothetical protein
LSGLSKPRQSAATVECPLCCSALEDSSPRQLRQHLRQVHPGANIYDIKFVALVNLMKDYQRGEQAYRVLRNLRE